MKTNLFLVTLTGLAFHAGAVEQTLIPTAVIGNVTAAPLAHEPSAVVTSNASVPLRREISTGESGQLMLDLLPGAQMRLLPNSRLVISGVQTSSRRNAAIGFTPGDSAIKSILTHHDAEIGRSKISVPTAKLELHSGSILMSSANSEMQIVLPGGLVSTSGALFSVSVDSPGCARLTVAQGVATLTLDDGQTVNVGTDSFAKFCSTNSGFQLTGPLPIDSDAASQKDFASLQGHSMAAPEAIGEYKEVLSAKEALPPVGELTPQGISAPGAVGLGVSAPFDLTRAANPANTSGSVVSREQRAP